MVMFKPNYTISDQIVSQLSEIAEVKSLVEHSQLLPAREAFLRRAAAIKMAHTSTSIEGNQLREDQVEQLAKGKKIRAQADQITEVRNYLKALRKIDDLTDEKHFSVEKILEIHKTVVNGLVEKGKDGVFRKGPVYIVNVPLTGNEELAYTPPASEQVPGLVEDLVGWLKNNQNIHPVIRAGLFHYQFETIHPFTDGNGRTGRLLSLLHLYQSGWDFKKVLVLEDYYNRNRKKYYLALQTGKTYRARQGVDLSPWLRYFVEGFQQEVYQVKEQILNLSSVSGSVHSRKVLNNDELKIVDFVVTIGRITSSDVVDILRVPKRTAQAKLKRLEEINVLQKLGAGPATYYSISRVTI